MANSLCCAKCGNIAHLHLITKEMLELDYVEELLTQRPGYLYTLLLCLEFEPEQPSSCVNVGSKIQCNKFHSTE